MTAQRDVKKLIRDRQTKTKESSSAARMHVMNERAALLAPELSAGPSDVEAIVTSRFGARTCTRSFPARSRASRSKSAGPGLATRTRAARSTRLASMSRNWG